MFPGKKKTNGLLSAGADRLSRIDSLYHKLRGRSGEAQESECLYHTEFVSYKVCIADSCLGPKIWAAVRPEHEGNTPVGIDGSL